MKPKPWFILAALAAGLSYFALNVVNLGSQGLYNDEVLQAVTSFGYTGKSPMYFSVLELHGIPLMNLSYIGAIKTGIYGLYLKLTGASFSVVSWRLVGITSVTFALVMFGLIVGRRISPTALAAFYALLVTDATILLTTRFDWGPAALSLSFRVLMIAVWIRGELSGSARPAASFWIGALLGISLFEKLSAINLVIPVLVMMFHAPAGRSARRVVLFLAGGLAGSLPLILVNLYSFVLRGDLISLQNQAVYFDRLRTLPDFLHFLRDYLSLGAGAQAGAFILGSRWQASAALETVLILLLLGFVLLAGTSLKGGRYRLPVVMLACYLSVALILYLFPTRISVHHWVGGTPFQYAAISLFVHGMAGDSRPRRRLMHGFIALLALFSLWRAYGVVRLEQAYLRGDASRSWSASMNVLGEFAAAHSEEAIFVVGDWGAANPLICFTNGQPGVVHPVDWNEGNLDAILGIVSSAKGRDVYFVFRDPPYFTSPETRISVLSQVEAALPESWRETPLDPRLGALDTFILFRFSRTTGP